MHALDVIIFTSAPPQYGHCSTFYRMASESVKCNSVGWPAATRGIYSSRSKAKKREEEIEVKTPRKVPMYIPQHTTVQEKAGWKFI